LGFGRCDKQQAHHCCVLEEVEQLRRKGGCAGYLRLAAVGILAFLFPATFTAQAFWLLAFVLFPLYNKARKVPAGASRQSCVLEASRDVRDIAGIHRCSYPAN
jgi:hypothetical protein